MSDSLVEARLARLQAWIVAGLAFMFVAAVSFLVVAVVVFVRASGVAERQRHDSDQALACFVQPQMDRAESTLPSLAYYKAHPQELQEQLAYMKVQRRLALDAWGACETPTP